MTGLTKEQESINWIANLDSRLFSRVKHIFFKVSSCKALLKTIPEVSNIVTMAHEHSRWRKLTNPDSFLHNVSETSFHAALRHVIFALCRWCYHGIFLPGYLSRCGGSLSAEVIGWKYRISERGQNNCTSLRRHCRPTSYHWPHRRYADFCVLLLIRF